MAVWPEWCNGLMSSTPGSIKRRFPTYWSDGEGGIDWSVKPGIPVTALADGVVVGAGYYCNANKKLFMPSAYPCSNPDYGVVTTRVTNSDGSQTDLYYQHILLSSSIKLCNQGIRSCGGQKVKKGDIIGTTNPGGFIELGINVGNSINPQPWPNGWGGIWGADKSPGPHIDPENYLRSLMNNYNGTGTGATDPVTGIINSIGNAVAPLTYATPFVTLAEKTQELSIGLPGFSGIIIGLDNVEKFQPWQLPTEQGSDSPILAGVAGVASGIAGTTIPVGKLPANAIQATLIFVVTNTMAFLIRMVIVIVGCLIVTTLLRNILGLTPDNIMKVAGTVGELAI